MKMGLSQLLIGHVNFLLGALVHGVVLRHINLHKQARAMEYAISNVVALTSGLVVSAQTHKMHTLILQQFCKFKKAILMASMGILQPVLHIVTIRFRKWNNKRKSFSCLCPFLRLSNVMSGDFPIRAVVAFWKPPLTHPLLQKKGPEIDLEKYCRKLSEWKKTFVHIASLKSLLTVPF